VEAEGFFYAPDPSSQLACAIAGNIAMNSGGAHCLKYGVTTNNLLGATVVLMDGTVVELGGGTGEALGLDLLAVVCGSEGQLGVVTEATLRILPRPEGARPVLVAFDRNETAGECVSAIIRAGLLPVAIEFMDRPCIEACEAFAKAGYPDCEALLIVEVEAEALGFDILRLCVEMGGCLTGEHGVGVEKRDLMTDQFAPADLEAQMRVKDAFDPDWLLNPAKVFPLAVSETRRRAA
jgi:glycolate oxidase